MTVGCLLLILKLHLLLLLLLGFLCVVWCWVFFPSPCWSISVLSKARNEFAPHQKWFQNSGSWVPSPDLCEMMSLMTLSLTLFILRVNDPLQVSNGLINKACYKCREAAQDLQEYFCVRYLEVLPSGVWVASFSLGWCLKDVLFQTSAVTHLPMGSSPFVPFIVRGEWWMLWQQEAGVGI